jgi:hypothetical protein
MEPIKISLHEPLKPRKSTVDRRMNYLYIESKWLEPLFVWVTEASRQYKPFALKI